MVPVLSIAGTSSTVEIEISATQEANGVPGACAAGTWDAARRFREVTTMAQEFGSAPVTIVPIEEVACRIAVAGPDDGGDSSLKPGAKAAVENAEAETGEVDLRRVRCTPEEARELFQYFDHIAATLQLAGDYERSTACAQAAERIRRTLEGPVLT